MSAYYLSKRNSKLNRENADPNFVCLVVDEQPAIAVKVTKQQMGYFKMGFDFGLHVSLEKDTPEPLLQIKTIAWAKEKDFLLHFVERIDLSFPENLDWIRRLVKMNCITCYLFEENDPETRISKGNELGDVRDQLIVQLALRDALKRIKEQENADQIVK